MASEDSPAHDPPSRERVGDAIMRRGIVSADQVRWHAFADRALVAVSRRLFWEGIMTGHLIVTDEDATRVITLRRPEKKNAITQAMYRAISEAIDTAQANPAIRCIILSGGPGVFTAGNDLEDFLKDGTSNTDAPRASNAAKFLYSLAHNVKPIIAAVDGVEIGIGNTLLFNCVY